MRSYPWLPSCLGTVLDNRNTTAPWAHTPAINSGDDRLLDACLTRARVDSNRLSCFGTHRLRFRAEGGPLRCSARKILPKRPLPGRS